MGLVYDGHAIGFDALSFVRFAVTLVASITCCGEARAGKPDGCGQEGTR